LFGANITDLARLMDNTNKNCEEEKNLLGDLPWDKLKTRPIPEFDEISFYDERFSKKKFIKWLTKLKTYFYFNKVSYHEKIGLIIHKLSCGAREWWFESLNFRTGIDVLLISS